MEEAPPSDGPTHEKAAEKGDDDERQTLSAADPKTSKKGSSRRRQLWETVRPRWSRKT